MMKRRNELGATAAEYVLIAAMTVLVLVGGIIAFRGALAAMFTDQCVEKSSYNASDHNQPTCIKE